ncbi:MAG: LysR family transcriptional regulator [Gammaproteobacteria bacterium]|nr:LysR family transcriptional regulator [Gammaproteobacteria bacterium]
MNAHIIDWNDIHVAYTVAQKGTLTAAAEALDVHHSTVLRRINALEKKLGTRLFHRHARGYTPTEAGSLLTQVAENTQNQFNRLLGQLQGTDTQPTGTLVVTTVSNMVSNMVPILAEFQREYPEIRLEYAAESRILRLEHGEAHISIRPGSKPTDPDYVVQHLAKQDHTLYGSTEYVATHGTMRDLDDTGQHRFISTIEPLTIVNFMRWMSEQVLAEQIYFRANDFTGFVPAVKAGLGIAPLSCWQAGLESSLQAMLPPPPQWQGDLWLATHRDMHRSSKVQVFTRFLKQRFAEEQELMLG